MPERWEKDRLMCYFAMQPVSPQLTADDVLRILHRSELSLFLGASFVTIGLLALAMLFLRRRFDALLFWLSLFAILYGARLWVTYDFLQWMTQSSDLVGRISVAFDVVVAIPAFFFLAATNLLGRMAKVVSYVLTGLMVLQLMANSLGVSTTALHETNSIIVIAALLVLLLQLFRNKTKGRDVAILRLGLLVFAAFALWNNIYALRLKAPSGVEPIGFLTLLGCLGYVAALRTIERERQLNEIHNELDVAQRIQLSILPSAFPASQHFRVAARYAPMTSVAGDFYDFLVTDSQHAGLLIADVSGHGVPAALIASMVKIAATSQRANITSPSVLLTRMNNTLYGNTQNQFVTAAYVYLDAEARMLRYSAAGHPPMLLLRKGEVVSIEENGLILAAFDFATYQDHARAIEPGDRILLYTDGIIEAANASGEFLGHDGLCAIIRQTVALPLAESIDHIFSAIEKWSTSQDDDRTIILCEFLSAE